MAAEAAGFTYGCLEMRGLGEQKQENRHGSGSGSGGIEGTRRSGRVAGSGPRSRRSL